MNFKLKIQANYQIYKGLMLLNIWSKYQSLLILNPKIIDATQKKLSNKIPVQLLLVIYEQNNKSACHRTEACVHFEKTEFTIFTDDDFPALITKFQIALYRYHHSTDENFNSTLYDPSTMRLFPNRHAPGLFDKILLSMEKNQKQPVSEKRHAKNLQRTVALLHILAYCRQGMITN